MEIILLQHVEGLGDRGDVVNVAAGHFRNFLGPQNLAVAATEGQRRRLAEVERVRELRQKKHRDLAGKAAGEIDGLQLEFRMKVDEEGHLFGSVSRAMIAQEMARLGKTVPSKNVMLEEPIKNLAEDPLDIVVRFPHEASATIKVRVVPE